MRRCLVGDDAVDADLTSAWKRREMRVQQREMRAQRLPLDGSSWWRPSPDWIWRGLEEGGDDHGKSPREETEGGSGIVLLFRDGRCLLLLNAGPNQSSQHPYDVCGFLFFSLFFSLPHAGAALSTRRTSLVRTRAFALDMTFVGGPWYCDFGPVWEGFIGGFTSGFR